MAKKSKIEFDQVKDSGKHSAYETGAKRDTRQGKGRFDLISPIALRRLAIHMENGAVKYSDRNWEKGIPLSRFFDSAIRHMYQFIGGDRSEDHLAAAMWNVHGIIHTEEKILAGELPESLNDLPNTPEKK
jgi:hypothetical protein